MELIYRMLYPARVCLITSRHAGRDNIMAASWVFPLSKDPPLFGVAVDRARYSHGLISKGRGFAINLPHEKMGDATRLCGTLSGREKDKFAEAGLTKEMGKRMPLVKECPVGIECELVEEKDVGDHTLFIGKAINVVRRSEAKGLYQDESGDFIRL